MKYKLCIFSNLITYRTPIKKNGTLEPLNLKFKS